MGNKNIKKSTEDRNSNSSVLNLSLETDKVSTPDSLIIYNNNNDNIIKELKNEVDLTIENEYIESSEIILEGKEEELKIKNFFENNENFSDEGIIIKKRSKTFAPIINIKNAPKPHPKESYEYISPLKLSIKSYVNIQKWNKKPNAVLYDFQKNIIDCKSCNDEDSLEDFLLFNSKTERTTPNVEDLHDLLNCRKKMIIFRNSIDDRTIKEYENILNSDYLFDENNNEININININKSKKNNFWCKHIKQQLLKDKNKGELHTKRIASVPLVNGYDSPDEEGEDKKEHGLFILGILESAANEKKKRNNTVVFNSDYDQL